MGFERFRREVAVEIFDYPLLAGYFSELKKPRDKVASLIAEGKIVRIKKGLYILGENWRRAAPNLPMIANLIYGPSCISFEYGLNRYGLIADRSTVITSLTLGDSKRFHTPIGTFEYRAIERERFKVGIEYRSEGRNGGFFIASKEKALADLVYRTAGIRSLDQLRYYLFEEMRVDEALFRQLDRVNLEAIAKAYKKNSVRMMLQL